MNKLEGKVAVITGAGGGIGGAIAGSLAAEKMKLVLLGGRKSDRLAKTGSDAIALGAEVLTLAGDLTDTAFLRDSVGKIIERFGSLDVLVNNAGAALNRSFSDTSEADFDAIMEINVRVPYFLTQFCLPYLKKSDYATVINIASVVGHLGYPSQSAYAASKHALIGFTKSFAAETYADGIRTHLICPGGVYTDMVKISRPDLTAEGMIMPEDIADIVLFFLKNRGNAVVDEILVHRVNKQPFLV